MAKEKKIVDITKDDTASNERFGKDSSGRIIKLEDNGDYKERAKTKRIIAIILWVIAIAFEVLGIARVSGAQILTNIGTTPFLIGCIILDLIFFVCGSQFWKKANHIDPASEKDGTKFWVINNLGTILSVLAFLPLIIVVLTNKDMDKKSKTIVTVIAAIALLVAGVTSYDFNPVSREQLERAEKEVLYVSKTGKVYWAKHSKKYHVDPDCPAFSQSEEVYEGTVKQAYEHNLTDPCRRCIPELKEEE